MQRGETPEQRTVPEGIGTITRAEGPRRRPVLRHLAVAALLFSPAGIIGCGSAPPVHDHAEPPPIHHTATTAHVVQRGETIASIARLHDVTIEAVLSANPGVEPRALRVGTVLEVPARKPVIRRVQTLTPASGASPTEEGGS